MHAAKAGHLARIGRAIGLRINDLQSAAAVAQEGDVLPAAGGLDVDNAIADDRYPAAHHPADYVDEAAGAAREHRTPRIVDRAMNDGAAASQRLNELGVREPQPGR